MDKFTASNGVEITRHNRGANIDVACTNEGEPPHGLGVNETSALREFFQAERDEALGRWRWPEAPDYVVYPWNGGCAVHLETSGGWAEFRGDSFVGHTDDLSRVVLAWRAAHPEPKPWHDARAGEAWVLTVEDLTPAGAYVAGDFTFRAEDHTLYIDDPKITSGRRIYPEVSA